MATPFTTKDQPKAGNAGDQLSKQKGDKVSPKNPRPKGPAKEDKYVGHTEDISAYVVTSNSTNKTSQYKEMQQRVITFASTKYSAEVGNSLENFQTLTLLDFMPDPLDPNLYSKPQRDEQGRVMMNDSGEVIMVEDTAAKTTLLAMQEHMNKDNTRLFTEYKKSLAAMYRVVYGQVDEDFKDKLAGLNEFKAIKATNDTIGLMRLIRDLCYQDERTKVHRFTSLIRALRKLLTVRQKSENGSKYAREVNDRFKVLKAMGGSILCEEAIEATMELEGKTLASYYAMNDTEKGIYNDKAEEAFVAALIIEGSNEDDSILRQRLAEQFALGMNNYPTTSIRAIEQISQFKGTKEKKTASKKTGAGKKDGGANKDSGSTSTKTTKTGTTNVTSGEVQRDIEGAQMLLAALSTNEQFNLDETVCIQLGEVHYNFDDNDNHTEPIALETQDSEADDDSRAAVTASILSDDDWNYWAEKDEADEQSPDAIERADSMQHVSAHEPNAATIKPALPEIIIPDRSEPHGDSSTTTLTADSENNSENNSSNSSRKRKASPEDTPKHEVTPKSHGTNRRPDPPGILPYTKPRSAPRVKPRSAPHQIPRDAGRNTFGEIRHSGRNNIAALDLAITDWQSYSFVRRQETTYRPSERLERMFAQSRGGIDPNWILLDSESSVNLIVNSQLLNNIRTAPNGTTLTVHCNAGSAITDKIGDLPGFGTVWYYSEGIANVISLGLLTNSHRVTMDSYIDNALYVHRDDGTIRRFQRGTNNLYYYDSREGQSAETLLTITTVEGQKEQFSGVDRRRAEKAYKLQEIMGFASNKDFVKMIERKGINNCPVTQRDFKIAMQIYGQNKSAIEGKTVRRQVPHVREEIEPVPNSILKNYQRITICCDIFHVNNVRFFGTISKHVKFRTVKGITNSRKSTLVNCIKTVIAKYAARGFVVEQVFADNQFECIRDDLIRLDPGVELNTTAKDEHEPNIERSNRTVKDRVRCIYHSTPFRHYPVRMIAEMVYSAVFWLNSFIPEDGVSQTMSPREIMMGYALDANKHARFQFGEYVMAHVDETNNSMDPRATDSIYLRPSGNKQGGFFVFDLNTGRRIHRMHGTGLPMTDTVISRVGEIARAQNAPEGLIFGDRNNNSTALDFEEADNEDDDNVSDTSYNVEEDARSVETELSNTTEITEVSQIMNERPTEEVQQAEANHEVNDMEVADAIEVEFNDDNRDAEDDAAPAVSDDDEQDDAESLGGNIDNQNESDDSEQSVTEQLNDNEMREEPDTQEADMDDIDDVSTRSEEAAEGGRRAGLRPVVRGHNYNEDEGYAPTIIHRGQFFTAGYGPAVRQLSREEIGHIHAASAIAQYNNIDASQVTQQYGVRQGIRIFGDEGVDAVLKELRQIHERSVIAPMDPNKMSKEQRAKALPYLMFLKRKRCGKVKGRGCADGRRQREFISREEASSPTVSLYALMLSCLIDAIEERDVATADIPGAFLQTDMPDNEEVYIRLDGTMADLLCRLDPDLYGPCMVQQGKQKVLYARAQKAIYGTLRAALLFWENLSGKLSEWGFEFNPYDACTMNKMIEGHQATILWHVDDLKISHKDPEVVTSLLRDLNEEFGKISPLTSTRGNIHDYVGMTIDYTEKGRVKFSMFDYLEDIIQGLPSEFIGEAQTPAGNHLFTVNEDTVKLSTEQADRFHHYVAKLLFMAKRTRPDIATAISFLCTRVKEPDEHDWKKLGRVMKYLQATPFLPLTLGWDGTGNVHWYVDASFAVHKDMRSHTGGLMTLGVGAVISVSTKQKINTKSSTEAELVGVDDILNLKVWSRYFLDSQYEHCGGDLLCKRDKLHQDNTSAMKLEMNGKASSTKRTRHINIRYFFITDQVKAGKVDVEYCPTDDMRADFLTKALQGSKFREHRNFIMGTTPERFMEHKDAYMAAKRHRNKDVSEPQ